MRYVGILILCAVGAFLMMVFTYPGLKEEDRKGVIPVFLVLTAIMMGLVCAVMFGISLIIHGG